jgi:hypothetical protein
VSFFYPHNAAMITETYRIALRFPAALIAKPLPEPLLSLGKFYQADFFYVRYLGENKVSLGFHHWGVGGPDSAPVTITPNQDYTADILVDSTMGTIEILLNGNSLLNYASPLYPHQENEIFIGRNPIGGAAAGPTFSGQATRVPKS